MWIEIPFAFKHLLLNYLRINGTPGNTLWRQTFRPWVTLQAVTGFTIHQCLRIAYSDQFGVDDRDLEFGFQFQWRNYVGYETSTQRNQCLSAFRNQFLSHGQYALDQEIVIGRQIAHLICVDRFNSRDETAHAIVLDNATRIDSMTIQWGNETEAITERCRKVARCAQHSDHRNPHRTARNFHAWIERIALHHGVEAQTLSFDRLLD